MGSAENKVIYVYLIHVFRYDLMVCVCKSQKDQIKMNLAVGNKKRNRVVKLVFMLLACVASVPVRQKSSETIFRKLAARKLGKGTEGTLARLPISENAHILIVDLTHAN